MVTEKKTPLLITTTIKYHNNKITAFTKVDRRMTHQCKGTTKSGRKCKRQIIDKRRKYCHLHASNSSRGGGFVGNTIMGATKTLGRAVGMVPVLGTPAQLATRATLSGQQRFFGMFDRDKR